METISNMANTAAKAVWGTSASHEEPISGKSGDVSKGEPYDAGNIEPGDSTGVRATDRTPTNTNTASANSGGTGISSDTYIGAPTSDTTTSGSGGNPPPPNQTQDSSTGRGDSSRTQGDVSSPSDPLQPGATAARQRSDVDDSGDGPDVDDNPAKLDGPGPRPIEEVARERGGDAGRAGGNAGGGALGGGEAKDEGAGGEDGPQKESHGEGTGEKYVKSTGLRADGGDFDAANPGAGKEAERLLDQKGVHRDPGPKTAGSDAGDSKDTHAKDAHSGGKDRKLGEKLKTKLHMGHASS
ncbi:putative glycine-rich cell wall structural protein 1 protein [Phialemonium atrogriseum]|uniref:Glycine-rich cell wall structural protein 1 protein n=1 Tax=Phialemonium atrogriseum TaxID=1093897 RepID=A0AAJ0C3X4_9PEZI|nr:putative glycine-rich cell wall structural protein 1 protein [Phialemonium atrogriseum]KAK1769052.1 putative glycine-rich cell wall structural protein 1 protein [Phialemonium atrogriseum]